MADIFDNPTDNFFKAFGNAFASGQLYTDTLRKNLAFNALQKTYGDEVGDIDLATKAETLSFDRQNNPLKLDQQRLTNESTQRTNDFNALNDPLKLEEQRLTNAGKVTTNESAQETLERQRRLQQARDVHQTLSGTLSSLASDLAGVTDPQQRLARFDQAVARLAPLLGADPAALAGDLSAYRQRIAEQGADAIPAIQQELDAAITAGMSPDDAMKLQTAQLGVEKAKVGLESERLKAEQLKATGGMTPSERLAFDKEQRKLDGERRAADQKITAVEQQADRTLTAIEKAKTFANGNAAATGTLATKVLGLGIANIGDTPQAKMEKLLDPIRTNVMLAAMDELSRMDARLTPMSDSDRAALEQMLGSLDPAAGKDVLIANLDNIAAFMVQAKANARASFEAAYGGGDDETLPIDDTLTAPARAAQPGNPPTVGDAAQQPMGGTLSNGLTWSLEP